MLTLARIRVAIADINIEQATAVAKSISDIAVAISVDAANWESQLGGFETVLKEFGRIDYVYASKLGLSLFLSRYGVLSRIAHSRWHW